MFIALRRFLLVTSHLSFANCYYAICHGPAKKRWTWRNQCSGGGKHSVDPAFWWRADTHEYTYEKQILTNSRKQLSALILAIITSSNAFPLHQSPVCIAVPLYTYIYLYDPMALRGSCGWRLQRYWEPTLLSSVAEKEPNRGDLESITNDLTISSEGERRQITCNVV